MESQNWSTAYASVVGSSHKKTGAPCQDAGFCRVVLIPDGHEVLLAVVSDGAGSAIRSEVGSELTVNHFMKVFTNEVQRHGGFEEINKPFVLDFLRVLHNIIEARANEEGLQVKDFACTLVAAIIEADRAIFFQVGDGAIVISEVESEEYGWVFWPQHGEFANQTNFIVQENLEEILNFSRIDKRFDRIALFTDGIERLVLDFANNVVHPPALRSIFDWLVQRSEHQREEAPSKEFIAYLSSDLITSRTDDDTTLVMATRASKRNESCLSNP
jgi:hypothetical protein